MKCVKTMPFLCCCLVILLVATVASGKQAISGKWFDHYVVIMMENLDIASALNNVDFQKVASSGILHTNYHAVSHPSQPNCKSLS